MSERPVLLDNVVLSNFLLANAETLLIELLARRMWVTPEILAENASGRSAGYAALAGVDGLLERGHLLEVSMDIEERAVFRQLLSSLGRGEASCVAIAKRRNAVFASDDRVAREAAAANGVPVTGSIGLLVAAVRRGGVSLRDADRALDRMIAAGFFSPVRSIAGLL